MGKDSRKGPQLILAALITTAVVGGAAATGSYIWASQNAYAAKVNGEVIATTEYLSIVERAKKQYAGQMGMDFNSEQGRTMLETLQKNIMNSLVDMTLMKQKAKEMNLTVTPDEYSARHKEFLRSRYQGNEQALEEDLKKNRITKAEFEKQFRDQILLQKLYQKVIAELKITDKDISDFYAKNKEKFTVPEQINAKHILIKADEGNAAEVKKAKATIDGLLAQVKGGANFEELAKKHSQDDGSKPSGGDLGSFGKGQMVPEFEAAAWNLKPGEVTPAPVKSKFGWHIIKRGPTTPGGTKQLAEVKDMIKGQIQQEKERTTFEAWLKKTKDASEIKVNDEMTKAPPVQPGASGSPAAGAPGAPGQPGQPAQPGQPGQAAPPAEPAAPAQPQGDGHGH